LGTITLGEVKSRVRKAMNEYSINGEIIGATDENRLDYDLRMNSTIDMHQRKIATTSKKISSSYVFSQYPPTNTLSGPLLQFDLVQYTGTTLTYSGSANVNSYYIEADGACTLTFKESEDGTTWATFDTATITPTRYGLFTASKDLLTPTADYYVKVEVDGTYDFTVRNVALYSNTYPTANDIPPYKDFRPYAMPDDFFQLHYIILNGQRAESKRYQKTSEWEQEGRNNIYIPFFEKGEYRVYYWAYPTKIDDDTLDSVTLDIDDEAIDPLVYGAALDLIDDERTEAYKRIQAKYFDFMARLDNSTPMGGTTISNTLFTSSSTNKLF
jgi:hypothetical protein